MYIEGVNQNEINEFLKSTFFDNEEKRLVKQSVKGDPFAQKCLYQKYAQAMYNVAIRMAADDGLAKDIIQESFIKVFSNLEQFKGQSSLGAWIKRITVNTAINQIQKYSRFRTEPIEYMEEKEDHVEENLIDLEVKKIHEAVKELPEKCRVIFNLYQVEGYNHAEIAHWLNISESTSKTQYMRAKKLVRLQLKARKNES